MVTDKVMGRDYEGQEGICINQGFMVDMRMDLEWVRKKQTLFLFCNILIILTKLRVFFPGSLQIFRFQLIASSRL